MRHVQEGMDKELRIMIVCFSTVGNGIHFFILNYNLIIPYFSPCVAAVWQSPPG